jgi:hypothetical protein
MPVDYDLKQQKQEREAKNANFAKKAKRYIIIALFIVIAYFSSLYSITAIETEGYTTNMLCIGISNVENDYKCYWEFTFTNRF